MGDKLYPVKAIEKGFYPSGPRGCTRDIGGSTFNLTNPSDFSPRWMEPIGWKPTAKRKSSAKGTTKVSAAEIAKQVIGLKAPELKKFLELTELIAVCDVPAPGTDRLDLMKLRKAIFELDHTVDDNWTPEGQPRLSLLTKIVGVDIIGEDVQAIAPDFDRVGAQEWAVHKANLEADEAAKKGTSDDDNPDGGKADG